MAKKKLTFEESLESLEKIIAKLEGGEETLESTLKLYAEGMEIGKKCQEMLDSAKQKVIVCEDSK